MVRTRERRGVREPRLYWHELPLGQLPVAGDVTWHQMREELLPLICQALLACFHWGTVVQRLQQGNGTWNEFISCDRFHIGQTEAWAPSRWTNWGDRNSVTVRYQLKQTGLMMWRKDPRRIQRMERPRVISGWLASGSRGGVSLYLQRHRRWKGGRYFIDR